MSRPRVLVTGAPGWLGTRLVEALADGFAAGPASCRGEAVRVLAMPGSDASDLARRESVEVVEADLRRPLPDDLCRGVETVFHCAGIVHPRRVDDLYSINVDGTRHLLDSAIAAGAKRIVFVSSNSPAGLNEDPITLMREDDPPRPYLNYGLSKMQAEWLVMDAHRAGRIQSVILRPCWFYGPNQPQRQTRFFRMIKGGRPIIFGRGTNLRSMSYVDNVVQGLLLARDVERAAGETYWIADRRPYSFIEIIETVARILDVRVRPLYLPRVGSDFARFADSLLQMTGLYSQDIHVAGELAATIAVSIDKAVSELGYAPEIELEEGMRRSIEWCRRSGMEI